tara:strand:- start:134 stop:400 length:267 start_codon:yes stop_codon:yes gene_type:complete
MALHTPTHVIAAPRWVTTVEYLYFLHLTMTLLTFKSSIHMTHMREMYMIGNLVNANPRDRISTLNELLNLGNFFRIVATRNRLMATPA